MASCVAHDEALLVSMERKRGTVSGGPDDPARPWPMRVDPAEGEALSSWLSRIALLYNVAYPDLLERYLGLSKNDGDINLTEDLNLINRIAHLSRVPFDKVRAMTFRGMVPFSFGKGLGSFADYVLEQTVLLRSWGRWEGIAGQTSDWQPWISHGLVRACRKCAASDQVIFARLEWLLPIMLSCPKHGCYLDECFITPGRFISWKVALPGKPSAATRWLDKTTYQAIVSGVTTDYTGAKPAALWFRKLRTVIEELAAPAYVHGDDRRIIKALWSNIGEDAPYAVRKTFENMKWQDQLKILQVAAFSMKYMGESLLYQKKTLCKQEAVRRAKDINTYLAGATSSYRWQKNLGYGGYKRAASDPIYASLLRSTLYWYDDVSIERACKVEEYLTARGVTRYAIREIRLVEKKVNHESSIIYFGLPEDGSWSDVRSGIANNRILRGMD